MHGERKPVVETRDRMGWRASTAGALPHHSGEAGSPFFTFFPFLFFQRGDLFIYHKRFTGVFRLSNIITQGESSGRFVVGRGRGWSDGCGLHSYDFLWVTRVFHVSR